jgi:hypothetical protein
LTDVLRGPRTHTTRLRKPDPLPLASVLVIVISLLLTALWAWSYQQPEHVGTWSRKIEGQTYPFLVERSNGVIFSKGRMVFVRGESRMLQAWVSSHRPYRDFPVKPGPVPLEQRRYVRDPDSLWPLYIVEERLTSHPAWVGFDEGYYSIQSGWAALPVTTVSWIVVPLWAPTVLPLLLPAWWATRTIMRRRRLRGIANGLCVRCGYDLRASARRCPECGAVFEETQGKTVKGKLEPESHGMTGG